MPFCFLTENNLWADSKLKCKPSFFECFSWGPESEFLPWSIVEPVEDVVQLFLGDGRKVSPLGQVLPDKAVCILIDGPVGGGVGAGEVDVDAQFSLKRLECGELLAVVHGQGLQ